MGDSLFFITADHAFGRDTSAFVAAAGGKVPKGACGIRSISATSPYRCWRKPRHQGQGARRRARDATNCLTLSRHRRPQAYSNLPEIPNAGQELTVVLNRDYPASGRGNPASWIYLN